MRCPPSGFGGRLRLSQRQPSVLEKSAAGRRQFDPASAARQQLNPDLDLEIADLPTERGLGPYAVSARLLS
jgi:hypothetical protein